MKVSVILPVLNESENIERAIRSVMNAGADEIIVVDGGSEDETREIASSMDCIVLQSETGRGIQQHHGALKATGDVFLFLHGDCCVGTGSIQQIRSSMKRGNCKFGAFQQQILQQGLKFRLLELGNLARVRLLNLPYGDQGIFIRRDFYFEIGGFPQCRLMEDVALSTAARKKTRPVVLSGPVLVNSRRWEQGVIRQTLFNWSILVAYFLGRSPEKLAEGYEKSRKTSEFS